MASEVGQYTFAQFFNASGGTLDLEGYFDHPDPFPYPNEIGNGDWAWFVHTTAGSSDVVLVVYRFNGDQLYWILSWENPLNSQNTATTLIVPSSEALRENWGSIQNKLKNATNGNESTSSYGGYVAHVSIGDGNFPQLQAVLTKEKVNN